MKATPISFRLASSLPADLRAGLKILAKRYPALCGKETAPVLSFKKITDDAELPTAYPSDKGWCIRYRKPCEAFRLMGQLLSGSVPAPEKNPFETVGAMMDLSRNAVRTVPYFKSVLERLAMLGYNLVMMYCEDTYKMPDEPFFGLHRGGYTGADIRELDDYAHALGIELVPCLETLGHLEQLFRWKAYEPLKDCNGNILANHEPSYKLLEKMIDFWASNVRSRKMHLGLDEAWGVGTGRYKELYGETKTFDIMCSHVSRLANHCAKRGLKPYMWGDMWFRALDPAAFSPETVQNKSVIPPEVLAKIPKDVTLCYWDYYNRDQAKYAANLRAYANIGCPVQMSSGVWTWNMFWHSMRHTVNNVPPCVRATREFGTKEILFTLWGDDGGFCDFESAFAGLAFAAEYCYAGEADTQTLERRYAALFGGASYAAVAALGAWSDVTSHVWDDPIMFVLQNETAMNGHWTNHEVIPLDQLEKGFATVRRTLAKAPVTKNGNGGDIVYARAFTEMLYQKMRLYRVYTDGKPATTPAQRCAVAVRALPVARAYAKAAAEFRAAFHKMWFSQNRPQGYETTQIRLAGVDARAQELVRRLAEIKAGKATDFPELADLLATRNKPGSTSQWGGAWRRYAHTTVIN